MKRRKGKVFFEVFFETLGILSLIGVGLIGGNVLCDKLADKLDPEQNRTVTVYDYAGKPLRSWTGKCRVRTHDGSETRFVIDGRRVIIQGGIIINEEQPETR